MSVGNVSVCVWFRKFKLHYWKSGENLPISQKALQFPYIQTIECQNYGACPEVERMSGQQFSVEEEHNDDDIASEIDELRSEVQATDTVEDNDDESITPSQLVKEITIAWQNEICAPRLLPHM